METPRRRGGGEGEEQPRESCLGSGAAGGPVLEGDGACGLCCGAWSLVSSILQEAAGGSAHEKGLECVGLEGRREGGGLDSCSGWRQ